MASAATADRVCLPIVQAAALEAFVSNSKQATTAAATRTAWLVAQQGLSQEAADASAALEATVAPSSAAAQLLGRGAGPEDAHDEFGSQAAAPSNGEPSADAHQQQLEAALEAADGCVEEALVLSAAAAALLAAPGGAGPSGPAALLRLRARLQAAEAKLLQATSVADAVAREMVGHVRRGAAAGLADAGVGPPVDGGLAEALRQLLSLHPLAAADCAAQLQEQAAELEARQVQLLQQRRDAYASFVARCRQQQADRRPSGLLCAARGPCSADNSHVGSTDVDPGLRAGDASSASGDDGTLLPASSTADGWSADEHAVFLHARIGCLGGGGGGEAALQQQLAALLPGRSAQAVLAHERWHREAARLATALRQQETEWRVESAAFLDATAALVADAEVAALARAEAALALLEAHAACLASAAAVEQGRAVREEQQDVEGLVAAAAAAAAAAQRLQAWQAREVYRGRMQHLLAEHKQRRQEQAAAAAAAGRKAAEEAAREAAAEAAVAKQRVQQRRRLDAAKGAERQAAEARRAAEQQQREAALAALRQKVAPALGRDAQRATGSTASSAAVPDPHEAQQHGLFAKALVGAGLSDRQVLADRRWRVYEALRQFGLHATPAGRQAVAAALPAGAQRLDLLTSAQRQAMPSR